MAADTGLYRGVAGWIDRQHQDRWRVMALSALAGMIAALGQAPVGLFPLTLLGLGCGAAVIARARGMARAALVGWALGLGYFGLTLIWIVQPFLVDLPRHGWMAPFALFFMAGGMALFWGLAGAGARWIAKDRALWLALGATFGLAELLRGWIFGGFPWGGPGLVWIDTPVAQLARVIGVYGMSALTVAFGAALWPVVARPWPRGLWALGGGALALSAPLAAPSVPATTDVTLRLVQPNAPQHLKWDQDWVMTFFERAVALSGHDGSADLVIWPETSIPAPLGRAPGLEQAAARAAAPAPLVAGIQRIEGRTWRNALVMFEGSGAPVWVYDKHHLVPFGEYVPLGNLAARFGIQGLAQRDGNGYAGGPGPVLRDSVAGPVLPLICYEMIFPRDIRGADGRANWILQATNDAWFGTFSGPQQHLVQARFRAIEFGLPIARAANTGISAVIDAGGTVTAHIPLGEAGAIEAPLPGPLPPTPYAKVGDLPVIVILLSLGLALFVANRRKAVDPAGAGR